MHSCLVTGDFCFDLSGAAQNQNAGVDQSSSQNALSGEASSDNSAEPVGLRANLVSVASRLGFDMGQFETPPFIGSVCFSVQFIFFWSDLWCCSNLSMLGVSSLTVKMSSEMHFRAVRLKIQTDEWRHFFMLESASGAVIQQANTAQSSPATVDTRPCDGLCFTLSSVSTGSYTLRDIMTGMGCAPIDPGTGIAEDIFNNMTIHRPSVVISGEGRDRGIPDFGMVISANVTYQDIAMSVTIAVNKVFSGVSAAVKLKINTNNALPRLLRRLNLGLDSEIPELTVNNINLLAATSDFTMEFAGLDAFSGMPMPVPRGVQISADFGWSSCNSQICRALARVFPSTQDPSRPADLRVMGGIGASGFFARFGRVGDHLDPNSASSDGWSGTLRQRVPGTQAVREFGQRAAAAARNLTSAAIHGLRQRMRVAPGFAMAATAELWPAIQDRFPLIWSNCTSQDLDLARLIQFDFRNTLSTDICFGGVNLDAMNLTLPAIASIFGFNVSSIEIPNFVSIDLNQLRLKTFLVKLTAQKRFSAALMQITVPDITLTYDGIRGQIFNYPRPHQC